MNVLGVLTKVPLRKVIKVVGVVALGTSSVMGAMETDEKVQKVIKKVAAKIIKEEAGV